MVKLGPYTPEEAARAAREREARWQPRVAALLTALEVTFLLAALAGVWLWLGLAAALVIGGTVGVLACEYAARGRRALEPGSPPRHVDSLAGRGHPGGGSTS